jgi:hypothetical protein
MVYATAPAICHLLLLPREIARGLFTVSLSPLLFALSQCSFHPIGLAVDKYVDCV